MIIMLWDGRVLLQMDHGLSVLIINFAPQQDIFQDIFLPLCRRNMIVGKIYVVCRKLNSWNCVLFSLVFVFFRVRNCCVLFHFLFFCHSSSCTFNIADSCEAPYAKPRSFMWHVRVSRGGHGHAVTCTFGTCTQRAFGCRTSSQCKMLWKRERKSGKRVEIFVWRMRNQDFEGMYRVRYTCELCTWKWEAF